MRLLLDTHAFLWFIFSDSQLSETAASIIGNPGNERWLSISSVWEISIKVQLGKLKLPSPLDHFLRDQLSANRTQLLPIEFSHAVAVHSMPHGRLANGNEHKDPFDRLIAAQANGEGHTLVSVDGVFDQYGVSRIW